MLEDAHVAVGGLLCFVWPTAAVRTLCVLNARLYYVGSPRLRLVPSAQATCVQFPCHSATRALFAVVFVGPGPESVQTVRLQTRDRDCLSLESAGAHRNCATYLIYL